MGNREMLESVRKRAFEIKKANDALIHTVDQILGTATAIHPAEPQNSDNKETNTDDFPTNPIARRLGDLVTAKQLGMIRAISRELQIDPDEECNAVMNCSTDELTKRAASLLIQHLQEKQKNRDTSSKPPLRRAN